MDQEYTNPFEEEGACEEETCRYHSEYGRDESSDQYILERIEQEVCDLEEIEVNRAMKRVALLHNYRRLSLSLPKPLYRRVLLLLSV
ncbi:MAG: hypothetical protein OXF62_20545 [Caldilineaceae bacterium]|nr:hypothetical protein [Caldilineaceae bacterium]